MSDGEGEGESERELLMFDVVFAEEVGDALRYVVKELCVVCGDRTYRLWETSSHDTYGSS